MPECIFCKIAAGEIKADVVYEDDYVLAFKDINPQAPIHVLIIPKKHIERADDIPVEELDVLKKMFAAVPKVKEKLDVDDVRLVFNCGPKAGQTVYHMHLHILGGRVFGWPPG